MPRYLIRGTIYGSFEYELDCPNEADARLEANEMAHLYTDMEVDVEELAPEDEWP
jgi:hypothetical protein